MDITIQPGKLSGQIHAIASKSMAHRLLICAAFSDGETELICPETNRDIEATVDCLNALGADIRANAEGYAIVPISRPPETAVLNCCESGSTLRFLLPIAGALGVDATFVMEGRLSLRPIAPLQEEMERMGCVLSRPTGNTLRCTGRLQAGNYTIDGGVSSQYITGLLFAVSLLAGDSSIRIRGKLESAPYVTMTQQAMEAFGVHTEGYHVTGGRPYHTPGVVNVEGDWSNGAFWIAAKALGSTVQISNLDSTSSQGDRAAQDLIPALQNYQSIDATNIPDLIPILSIVAAANQGAEFRNIGRLRLKESDRVAAIIQMLHALGGAAFCTDDVLNVRGTGLTGGVVDSCSDHRIAMSAAIAATVCKKPVTVLNAQAVNKSYPSFWETYRKLGGNYEQHIR